MPRKAATAEAKKATAAETKKTAAAETKKATVKKTPVRRTAKKAAAPEIEVYVQFWGKEVFAKEVKENILKIWTDEMGHKMDELKDLKIYIKPEDNGAHYVFNGEITGFLAL